MATVTATVGLAALLAAALLTALVRNLAVAAGVLDIPNQRSSHQTPIPRGGGAAIVAATTAALGILSWLGELRSELLMAMVGGGLAVAAIGFVDDRRPVPPAVRLAVHVGAALWALFWVGGLGPLQIGEHSVALGGFGYVLGVLGIVWVLNLFNFMDGIDGIAASEATFVAWGGAWLTGAAAPGSAGVAPAAAVFGAACLGFLGWNWPPARVFMGDVGSGYVGYLIAVLALAATRHDPAAVWVWLILGGVFFVDATVTLVRRVLRGESAQQAHREHAYQHLARRWSSHGKVTVTALAVNLVWLLPCAVLAARRPQHALAYVGLAFAPLAVLAVTIGAGRRPGETPDQVRA
jgi:Fuc2NAc and GlcNAc transferase